MFYNANKRYCFMGWQRGARIISNPRVIKTRLGIVVSRSRLSDNFDDVFEMKPKFLSVDGNCLNNLLPQKLYKMACFPLLIYFYLYGSNLDKFWSEKCHN